jgi:hypothetical protein
LNDTTDNGYNVCKEGAVHFNWKNAISIKPATPSGAG